MAALHVRDTFNRMEIAHRKLIVSGAQPRTRRHGVLSGADNREVVIVVVEFLGLWGNIIRERNAHILRIIKSGAGLMAAP